jgi:hypothetical protein
MGQPIAKLRCFHAAYRMADLFSLLSLQRFCRSVLTEGKKGPTFPLEKGKPAPRYFAQTLDKIPPGSIDRFLSAHSRQ